MNDENDDKAVIKHVIFWLPPRILGLIGHPHHKACLGPLVNTSGGPHESLDELMDIELAGSPWSLLRVLRRIPWDCSIENWRSQGLFQTCQGSSAYCFV